MTVNGEQCLRTKDGGQGLGGIEELGGGNGIVLLGIDRDSGEGLLEGLDNSAAGGDDRSRHDDNVFEMSCRSWYCLMS